MFNLIEDINKLTNISVTNLNLLSDLCTNIIAHDILEGKINKNNDTIIDIGIGEIVVKNLNDKLIYKFIPCEDLENKIIRVYKNNKSPLKEKIDETLGRRINNTYKNLF